MPGVNVVVGNDGVNNLSGSAGNDLIYGFDPNGPQSNVNSIAATRVATGLSGALFATAAPEDSQRLLFIVQQNGTVRVLDLDSGQLLPTPFITLPVDSAGERGLLGMTFDPDYATNGFVYFYQTVTTGGTHNEIVRYHVNPANPNVVDGTTPTTIINIGPLSAATNHNGGWIGFGPDGYLYAAVGDNANGDNAQTTTNLLGKILRIDVHNDAFPGDSTRNYAIPSDNMFAATAGADEIFALGLRNPFRDSFDRGTGEFFIADVGESTWEEIDLGRSGANYGWPLFEGPAGSGTVGAGTLTGPIYSYNHSVGIAVIGGYAYRGTSEGLQGQYFFADLGSGHVSTLRFDGSAWVATDRTSQIHTDVGTISSPTSFGEDAKGNLYIVDLGGDVFRLTPNAVSADQGDTLRGFGGNDMMFGGSGDDLLDGGTGQDTMTGGPGADHFVFAPGYGRDIVNDFVTSGGVADRIDLTAFTGVYTLIDVLSHTTQVGADAVIDFGNGDTLRLLGVTKASLSWDDFSFGAAVQGDFGGNGHEDILWRRDDGSASIWDDGRIGGGHIISGAGVMGSSWHIAGTGDFDGNGRDDILWRNDDATLSVWDNGQSGSAHVISGAGVMGAAGTSSAPATSTATATAISCGAMTMVWSRSGIMARSAARMSFPAPVTLRAAGTSSLPATSTATAIAISYGAMTMAWSRSGIMARSAVRMSFPAPASWRAPGTLPAPETSTATAAMIFSGATTTARLRSGTTPRSAAPISSPARATSRTIGILCDRLGRRRAAYGSVTSTFTAPAAP